MAVTNAYLTNLASALLGVNSAGQIVSTSSIGTNLLSSNTISGVALGQNLFALSSSAGSPITFSGSYTGASAQTVNLNFGNAWNEPTTSYIAPTSTIGILIAASSTITNLSVLTSTTTYATTTNLALPNLTSQLLSTNATGGVQGATIGGGLSFTANTLSLAAGNNFGNSWNLVSGYLTPTSTSEGILVGASSTLSYLSSINSTSTNATSTNLFSTNAIHTNATSTNLAVTNAYLTNLASALLGVNSAGQIVSTSSIGTNLLSSNTISGVALGQNLFALSSSAGSPITFSGSYTGASAQTVNLNFGNAWNEPTTSYIAPTSTIGILIAASSTITNLSVLTSTTTYATTTNLALPNLTSQLLSTNATGGVQGATIGGGLSFTANTLSLAAGNNFGNSWNLVSGYLTPTSTSEGILVGASSTLSYLSSINSTSTNATSTNSFRRTPFTRTQLRRTWPSQTPT